MPCTWWALGQGRAAPGRTEGTRESTAPSRPAPGPSCSSWLQAARPWQSPRFRTSGCVCRGSQARRPLVQPGWKQTQACGAGKWVCACWLSHCHGAVLGAGRRPPTLLFPGEPPLAAPGAPHIPEGQGADPRLQGKAASQPGWLTHAVHWWLSFILQADSRRG